MTSTLSKSQDAVNAMQINGVDAQFLTPEEVRNRAPILNFSPRARYPILGRRLSGRAGTGRHDAVVWAYARAADRLGVDIIQNCEVTGFRNEAGKCTVDQPRRDWRAAHCGGSRWPFLGPCENRRIELPLNSYALQAFVSEPIKPVLDTIVSSPACGVPVSASPTRGVWSSVEGWTASKLWPARQPADAGGGAVWASGNGAPVSAGVKLLRQWAGIVDVSPDSSPIIGPSGVPGIYLNCGWGTGGFKAIPAGGWLTAHLVAKDAHHRIQSPVRHRSVPHRTADRRGRGLGYRALRRMKGATVSMPFLRSAR